MRPPFTRLGAYQVIASLAAGGMGEVYLARDTRLPREVAIKVLPADHAFDDRRRRRFLREAELLSSLSHPHIVTIYELDREGEVDFIVMELVHGASLDALIPARGLRLGELLRIAIPAADAVAAAHARGIIHRDLKPGNILIREDGAVKVLDFGLATLMVEKGDAPPPTASDPGHDGGSAPGRAAGTAAYMAPEQAIGGRVDARSDVFSFGATLYQMATGRRAFKGESAGETLEAVLRSDPTPPRQIVPGLPRDLERLILRCLRKDPGRRCQTMLDVRNELLEIEQELTSSRGPSAAAVHRGFLTARRIAGAAILLLVAAGWAWWSRPHVAVPPPRVLPVTSLQGHETMPTVSPDGAQVAFAWEGDRQSGNVDIYVAMIGAPTVWRVTMDPAMDVFPSWSPDGRHLAFVRQQTDHAGRVYIMSSRGGDERKLSDFDVHFDRLGRFGRLSWSPDGQYIVAARPSTQRPGESTGIYLLPLQGGSPRLITRTVAPRSDRDPALSPDGRRLAYFSCDNCCWGGCDVMSLDLNSEVAPAGDPRRLTSLATQMEGAAWARDGRTVVFGSVAAGFFEYLWRVDSEGQHPAERLEVAGLGARLPATVPAHDRLVFSRSTRNDDIYRLGSGGVPQPIRTSSVLERYPVFSPDGRWVAYCSARSGEAMDVWVAGSDGSGARQLSRGLSNSCAAAWAPSGRTIVFTSVVASHRNIWTVDIDGGNLRQLTTGPGKRQYPSYSRDGAWIYFSKPGSLGSDIWRIPSEGGPEHPVTRDGGYLAFETADGNNLVYQPEHDRGGAPVLLRPLATGLSQELVKCAYGFSVSSRGVYYYPCASSGPPVPLSPSRRSDVRLIDLKTRTDRHVLTVGDLSYGDVFWGPRFSPDGRTIVYSRIVNWGEDLMMIENFR